MTLSAAMLVCCIVGVYTCIIVAIVRIVREMIEDERQIRRMNAFLTGSQKYGIPREDAVVTHRIRVVKGVVSD